jgi:hypothetical protein
MSTTVSKQAHIEKVLVEVVSLLLSRARVQLEREAEGDLAAESDLRRLEELDKELRAIRRDIGAPSPAGRQVSRFYEVPGQEDA